MRTHGLLALALILGLGGVAQGQNGDAAPLAAGRVTYDYNETLDVAQSVAVADSRAYSVAGARQLLDGFYQQLRARGGQRNNLADVGALIVFANHYVMSGGKELTPRQYAATRDLMRQQVLASDALQQASDGDLQYRAEKMIIDTSATFTQYQSYQSRAAGGDPYAAKRVIEAARASALSTLDVLFAPDGFHAWHLTPDGFAR